MPAKKFVCPKCASVDCEIEEVQVVSGKAWSFKKGPNFTAVVCSKCNYTELYKKN